MNNYLIKKYWKLALLISAALIAAASLWYTNTLVDNLKAEERQKARIWADATRVMVNAAEMDNDVTFPLSVVMANGTIPVIATIEDSFRVEGGHKPDSYTIIAHRNLDSAKVQQPGYLNAKIAQMRSQIDPIELDFVEGQKIVIYYEHSILLTQLRWYPYIQLTVIGLFLLVSYFAFSYSRRSEQNQVWVGMSKETAHQLGTPISSMVAWLELLGEEGQVPPHILEEMENDLNRLEIITERFSKIGSEPVLTDLSIGAIVTETVTYLRKRLSSHVQFEIHDESEGALVPLNAPLFAWVIENITKNAVDAMEGSGKIDYRIYKKEGSVCLEISDTGKGIPSGKFKTIFKPGYTTKKRGWGLGLSLVKRIVENYHRGKIIVKESIPNQRTTFKITLK